MSLAGTAFFVCLRILATPSVSGGQLSMELPSVRPLVMTAPPALRFEPQATPSVTLQVSTSPAVESDALFETAMLGVGLMVFAPIASDFAGRRSQAIVDDVAVYARALTLSGAALAVTHQLFATTREPGVGKYMSATIAAITAIAMGIGYQSDLEWLAFGADMVLGGVVAAGALVAGEYHVDEVIVECSEELAIGTLEKCLKHRPTPPVHVRFRSASGGGMLAIRMSL